MNIVEVQHVVKRFVNQTALDDLSLEIPRGKVFGLLGPNGAGKTTLIRILTGINTPDSGSVLFNGHPLAMDDVFNIGYLPEERGLYKKMKVSEQCIYLARLRGLSKQEAEKRLKLWFAKFGIDSWWNRKVEELSKGMQQKIQFVITVIHQPDFLIFDEPFSGFDPINAELLKNEILQLKKEGATIILSTHNMSSVEEICDSIALVNHGKNVLSGSLDEVRHAFRKSQYSITLKANTLPTKEMLPVDCQLLESEQVDNLLKLKVQLPSDMSANSLLENLIKYYTILSFNEIIPSMNDIFIQTVQSQTKNASSL